LGSREATSSGYKTKGVGLVAIRPVASVGDGDYSSLSLSKAPELTLATTLFYTRKSMLAATKYNNLDDEEFIIIRMALDILARRTSQENNIIYLASYRESSNES
jgi:hypothetical protein